MRKNKTKNNKSNKNRNNMDIIETRVRRFVAMIIDWYLTNMLAAIPITFYLRGNDYLKPYMFDLTHYDFSIGLALGLYGVLIGIITMYLFQHIFLKDKHLVKKYVRSKSLKKIMNQSI